jgi:hypothetical protein
MRLRKTTKTLSRNKRSPEESVQKTWQETANREGRKNKELCKKRRNQDTEKPTHNKNRPYILFSFYSFFMFFKLHRLYGYNIK